MGLLRRLATYARNRLDGRLDLAGHRLQRQQLFDPLWLDVVGTTSLAPLGVRKFAQLFTAMECGEFYCEHLYSVPFFEDYMEHVAQMARRAAGFGNGAFLEFGVATGRTISAIAGVANRGVVGFDWFKGLPEDWREGVKAGAFAGKVPDVPSNVSLEIGLIEETLPRWLEKAKPAEIQFIHIDTDLYAPAKTILTLCAPFIRHCIIVFDEFYNYPGWRHHEYKAFCEFRDANAGTFDVRFIGCGGNVAVSVEVVRR